MTNDIEHKRLNFKSILILLLCGFIVFSPISSKISMNILNLPLALPEILFLPFYFYLKKRIDLTINKKVFLIGLFIILFLIAISFLVDNFPPTSILSPARGYFNMLLSFSIFINKEIKNINYIMFLAFGSTIGWLYANFLFIDELINSLSFNKSLAVYGNMIMLSLTMSIPIIFKKSKYVYLALIGGLLLSFSSGTRRQIIIFFSSYILSFLLAIKWSFKGVFKTILVALISFSFFLTIYPIAEEFIYDISSGLHRRIFIKSEQLISREENSSDVHRTGSLLNFLNNLDENLFTRGFVSKRTMQDKGTGLYMDSPYTELFYTFSSTGAIFILLLLIKRLFFHFKNYLFKGVTESGLCVVSITTIFILIMVEGSFLNWSYVTICTGYILARIFSSRNLIKT